MRVAVLSDIHGNLVALDAVLARRRIGRRGLAPRRRRRLRTRARRRRRATERRRRASASAATTTPPRSAAARSTGSTRTRGPRWSGPGDDLRRRPGAWLAALPERRERSTTSRSSTAARAIRSGSTSTRPPVAARQHRRAWTTRLRAARPYPRPGRLSSSDDGRRRADRARRRLDGSRLDGRPGAAQPGQRRPAARRRSAAAYLVLDPDAGSVTWHRVAYDVERGPGGHAAAGLPARLGDRLAYGAVTRSMIGGRRPLQGRKPGDKRLRVERPHAPYFRYTGKGQLTAKEAASVPTTPPARLMRTVRGRPARPAAAPGGGDRRAPVQDEGAGDLQLRRDQLLAPTPPRRSSSRSSSAASRRGAPVLAAGRHRDRRAPRGRGVQLPPGVHRLPDRRRLVLRLEAQLRAARLARRGIRAADRLHPDRGRLDLVRASSRSCRPFPALVRRARHHRRQRPRADHARATSAACARPATSSPSRPTCSCSAPSR